MFYYYGRKKRIAGFYQEPEYETIIEPFGGSGAYSLHGERWKKNVIINDLSPITFMLWRYLQNASLNEIECLPEPKYQEKLSDYKYLSEEERWLISFHINPGANQRSNIVQKFNRWSAGKKYIISNLHKIKHWIILNQEYHELDNTPAAWFIDPPYQKSGCRYMTNTVTDYFALGDWCKNRLGQVIVCEQDGADWLDFRELIDMKIAGKKKIKEFVWYKL